MKALTYCSASPGSFQRALSLCGCTLIISFVLVFVVGRKMRMGVGRSLSGLFGRAICLGGKFCFLSWPHGAYCTVLLLYCTVLMLVIFVRTLPTLKYGSRLCYPRGTSSYCQSRHKAILKAVNEAPRDDPSREACICSAPRNLGALKESSNRFFHLKLPCVLTTSSISQVLDQNVVLANCGNTHNQSWVSRRRSVSHILLCNLIANIDIYIAWQRSPR